MKALHHKRLADESLADHEIVDIEIPELAYVSAVGMSILVPDTSEWHRELLRRLASTSPDASSTSPVLS